MNIQRVFIGFNAIPEILLVLCALGYVDWWIFWLVFSLDGLNSLIYALKEYKDAKN